MYSCLLVFLTISLFTVLPTISEDTTAFEGRWIKRPPEDIDFPHAVLIRMSKADDEICSGSLITYSWILTAARCMYQGQKKVVETDTSLTIYAGVDNDTQGAHVQTRISKKISIHDIPGKDSYFSLALVKVDPPFEGKYKRNKVNPLGTLDYESLWIKGAEETCKSGSYGGTEWDKNGQLKLKRARIVIQQCNCSVAIREAFPDSLTDQWFCGEREDNIEVCKGDFGAALQCDNLVAVPINIVTFSDSHDCVIDDKVSSKCNKLSTVGIYTDVCFHLDWIHEHIPSIPVNLTACDVPDSAISVRHCGYGIFYFVFVCFLLHFFFL